MMLPLLIVLLPITYVLSYNYLEFVPAGNPPWKFTDTSIWNCTSNPGVWSCAIDNDAVMIIDTSIPQGSIPFLIDRTVSVRNISSIDTTYTFGHPSSRNGNDNDALTLTTQDSVEWYGDVTVQSDVAGDTFRVRSIWLHPKITTNGKIIRNISLALPNASSIATTSDSIHVMNMEADSGIVAEWSWRGTVNIGNLLETGAGVTTRLSSAARVLLTAGASFGGDVALAAGSSMTSRGALSFTSLVIDQGNVVMDNDESLRIAPNPNSATKQPRGHVTLSGQNAVLSGVDISITDTDCQIDGSLQGPPNIHVAGDVTMRGTILVDSLTMDGSGNLTLDASLSPKRSISITGMDRVTFNSRTILTGSPQTTYFVSLRDGTKATPGVITLHDATITSTTFIAGSPLVLTGSQTLALTARANLTLAGSTTGTLAIGSKLIVSGTPVLQSGSWALEDTSSIYLNGSDTILTLSDTTLSIEDTASITSVSPSSQLVLACSDLVMDATSVLGVTAIKIGTSKSLCIASHLNGANGATITLRPATTVNISDEADFQIIAHAVVAPALTIYGGGQLSFPASTTITGLFTVAADAASSEIGVVSIPQGGALKSGVHTNFTFMDNIRVTVEGTLYGGDSDSGSLLIVKDTSRIILQNMGHLSTRALFLGNAAMVQSSGSSATIAGTVMGNGQSFMIGGTLLIDDSLEIRNMDVDVGVASWVYVRGTGILILSGSTSLMLEANAQFKCDAQAKVQVVDNAQIGADGSGEGSTPYPDCSGLELVSPKSEMTVSTVMRVFRDSQIIGQGILNIPTGGQLLIGSSAVGTVTMRINVPNVSIAGMLVVDSLNGQLAALCSQVYIQVKGMLKGNVSIGDHHNKCNGLIRLFGSLQGATRIIDGSSVNIVGTTATVGPAAITCVGSGVINVDGATILSIAGDTDIYCPSLILNQGSIKMPVGVTTALTFHGTHVVANTFLFGTDSSANRMNLADGSVLYLRYLSTTHAVISICPTCQLTVGDSANLMGTISGSGVMNITAPSNTGHIAPLLHQLSINGAGAGGPLTVLLSPSSMATLATVSSSATNYQLGASSTITAAEFNPTACNIQINNGATFTLSPTSGSKSLSIWSRSTVTISDSATLNVIGGGASLETTDATVIRMSDSSKLVIDGANTWIATEVVVRHGALNTPGTITIGGMLSIGTIIVDPRVNVVVTSTGILHFGISARGTFGDVAMNGLATFGDANWMTANSITMSETSRLVLVIDVNDPLDLVAINSTSIHLDGTLNITLNGAAAQLADITIPLMYTDGHNNITGAWRQVNVPRGSIAIIGGMLVYRPGPPKPSDGNDDTGATTRLIIIIAASGTGGLLLIGLVYYCCRRNQRDTSGMGSSSRASKATSNGRDGEHNGSDDRKPIAKYGQTYAKYTAVGEF